MISCFPFLQPVNQFLVYPDHWTDNLFSCGDPDTYVTAVVKTATLDHFLPLSSSDRLLVVQLETRKVEDADHGSTV